MNSELENLQELLDVLRGSGVKRYQNGGLVIELEPTVQLPVEAPEPVVTRQADRIAAAERAEAGMPLASAYDHPSLFPGGKPKFPGSR